MPHQRLTQQQREARATDFRRSGFLFALLWLLLSLLSWSLSGCARPVALQEQKAERMAPATYTDAAGFEVPVPADTARVAGW